MKERALVARFFMARSKENNYRAVMLHELVRLAKRV